MGLRTQTRSNSKGGAFSHSQEGLMVSTCPEDTAWTRLPTHLPIPQAQHPQVPVLTVALSRTLMEPGSATLCLRRACSNCCRGGRSHLPKTTRSMSLQEEGTQDPEPACSTLHNLPGHTAPRRPHSGARSNPCHWSPGAKAAPWQVPTCPAHTDPS